MSFKLTPIADNGDQFSSFGEYVPSINNRGEVAFYASLRSTHTGIFVAVDAGVVPVCTNDATIRAFSSHPEIIDDGSWCVIAGLHSGASVLARGGEIGGGYSIAGQEGLPARLGPLGPTMNAGGTVALRAVAQSGRPEILILSQTQVMAISRPDGLVDYEGLAVINDADTVVFGAEFEDGTRGIFAHRRNMLETLADTTGDFAEFGRFPCINGAGAVAFSALLKGGGSGIFVASDGAITNIVDTSTEFAAVRGALISDDGTVIFLATPKQGMLGVYVPDVGRVLGLGDSLFDSVVVNFALNPVSINATAQMAIRVGLFNGREMIVRVER